MWNAGRTRIAVDYLTYYNKYHRIVKLMECKEYTCMGGGRMETKKIPKEGILFYLKCLLFSYIITGLLLMLLALLLYKFRLTEQVVSAGIILIYVAASFFSGFVTGKKRKEKKFLWGLLMGTAYFLILTAISLGVNRNVGDLAGNFLTAFLVCAGSGMLGGMLS